MIGDWFIWAIELTLNLPAVTLVIVDPLWFVVEPTAALRTHWPQVNSETLDRQNSETSFKNWPPVDAGMCDCVSHPLNVPLHPFGPQCASICYSRPSFEEDRQGGWSAKQLVDRSPKVVLAKPNRATGQAKRVKGAKSRILIDEHFQMLYMQTYSALNICHGAIQAYQLLGTL